MNLCETPSSPSLEGNGPNDPIDPEDPGDNNFNMVGVNFIGKVSDWKWPGGFTWEYLRGLQYNDI